MRVNTKYCLLFKALCVGFVLLVIELPLQADEAKKTAPSPESAVVTAELVDRAVVAVNYVTYSQRQVETYLFVKAVLKAANEKKSEKIPWKKSWLGMIEHFIDDMVIHQESQRVSSFLPPENAMSEVMSQFKQGLLLDNYYVNEMNRIRISKNVLEQNLLTLLRNVAFKNSKDKQQKLITEDGENQDWFKPLRQNAFVRYYSGYETYQDLSGFKPSL